MLEAIMRNHTMVAEAWKTTFRIRLTPAQYVVWDSEFHHACTQRGANSGGAFILDQLYGSGPFATPVAQIVLPTETLNISSDCAFHAFQKVLPPDKPSQSFSTICQTSTESYSDFINRL